MNSFLNSRLRDHQTPLNTVWLLNDIARPGEFFLGLRDWICLVMINTMYSQK